MFTGLGKCWLLENNCNHHFPSPKHKTQRIKVKIWLLPPLGAYAGTPPQSRKLQFSIATVANISMGGGRGDSAPAFWHPQSEALPIPFLYPFKAKGSLGCSAFSADAGPELLRLNSSRKNYRKKHSLLLKTGSRSHQ